MSGHIVMRTTGVGAVIEEADDEALLHLSLIQDGDERIIRLGRRQITFRGDNGDVTYDIVGWNYDADALVLHKADDGRSQG